MDRKAELELKKASLQTLREEKERRRKEREQNLDLLETSGKIANVKLGTSHDLDMTLSSLTEPLVSEVSLLSSVSMTNSDNFIKSTPSGNVQSSIEKLNYRQKPVNLSLVSVDNINISPKKTIVYSKHTQSTKKEMIMLSKDFQQFMANASKVIEKALSETKDIHRGYIGGTEANGTIEEKSHARLLLNRMLYCDHWSKDRCVTSIDWSMHYPELMVASYYSNEFTRLRGYDPEGVVAMWNAKSKKQTPEQVFHCQSGVMSTSFVKFNANLILGGTYSGQIVLWDSREQRRTPIHCIQFNVNGHILPVVCVSLVGTQHSHNVISISSDGKLCKWSLDMLSKPQDVLEFKKQPSQTISVTCSAVMHSQVKNIVLGSVDGCVYSANQHDNRGAIIETYREHLGPITAVSAHQSESNFDHLFLTSSVDSTVKLWSLQDNKPLYTFEDNSDYVACSPINPALFASVDGNGRLNVWNLNQNTDVPVESVVVDEQPALNRVFWTPYGRHVMVGAETGHIYMYDLADRVANPRIDEWNKLDAVLYDLRM
ncbi:cytoplasmic dynein 1 intermediate chain-like [Anopheles ziemanni]|uniref:cytoplasmic dynein 1 intermediate chain-like n=1 Tax=Anopheles coustani TaxID=139045 RepID=UPI0026597F4D|nr:cytoplasmic dynein 1 intermediate chain-like [Anopheles coustani]XP_058178081.1 cytoplasmic dynein 1 intermediate chain-like [Anopheles ziemanni]